MTIVGFTGSREGMRNSQHKAFIDLMWEMQPREFHHGACVGADAEAVLSVQVMSHAPVKIIAHPGHSAKGGENELLSRPALEASDEVRESQTHFARNRAICDECEVLVAAPRHIERPPFRSGGGTWFTIEYGEHRGMPVFIIWPDGKVDR